MGTKMIHWLKREKKSETPYGVMAKALPLRGTHFFGRLQCPLGTVAGYVKLRSETYIHAQRLMCLRIRVLQGTGKDAPVDEWRAVGAIPFFGKDE